MLNTYNVTIKATITKTIAVLAASEEDAEEKAHDEFSVLCDGDGMDEDYQQDTISIEGGESD